MTSTTCPSSRRTSSAGAPDLGQTLSASVANSFSNAEVSTSNDDYANADNSSEENWSGDEVFFRQLVDSTETNVVDETNGSATATAAVTVTAEEMSKQTSGSRSTRRGRLYSAIWENMIRRHTRGADRAQETVRTRAGSAPTPSTVSLMNRTAITLYSSDHGADGAMVTRYTAQDAINLVTLHQSSHVFIHPSHPAFPTYLADAVSYGYAPGWIVADDGAGHDYGVDGGYGGFSGVSWGQRRGPRDGQGQEQETMNIRTPVTSGESEEGASESDLLFVLLTTFESESLEGEVSEV